MNSSQIADVTCSNPVGGWLKRSSKERNYCSWCAKSIPFYKKHHFGIIMFVAHYSQYTFAFTLIVCGSCTSSVTGNDVPDNAWLIVEFSLFRKTVDPGRGRRSHIRCVTAGKDDRQQIMWPTCPSVR